MAAFNPELPPSPEPNFTSYLWQGRPIQEPQPDKSGATMGKAYGELIKGIASVGDNLVKGAIDAKVHDSVDEQRDAFTSALNSYKDTTAARTDSESQQAKDLNLMSAPPSAVVPGSSGIPGTSVPVDSNNPPPPGVVQGISQAQSLASANKSGKINETYYYGNLVNIAKSLRSQFPGYRDYVDEKIAQVSGVNPANAYMKSIIETVNQANAAKKGQSEYELHQAMEVAKSAEASGNPAVRGIFGLLSNGQITPAQAISAVGKANQTAWQWKNAVEQNAGENAGKDLDKRKLSPDLDHFLFRTMTDTETATSSVHGLLNDDQLRKAINDEANGTNPRPSEFWQNQGVLRDQAKENIKAYMEKQMNTPLAQDPQHRTAVDIWGKEAIDQKIEQTLKTWDDRTAMIRSGKVAMADFTKTLAEGQNHDDVWQTRNDPVFGQDFRKWEVLRGKAPPEVLNTFVNHAFIQEGKMNDWTNRFKLGFLTGTKNPDGSPFTFDQAFHAMKQRGVTDPKDYASLVRMIPQTANSQLPVNIKHDFYTNLFSPNNQNFLSDDNLNSSTWDGHRWIPGKEAVFNQALSPKVLKDVHDTSKSTDPQLWNDTVAWAKNTFGQQIFNKEVIKLNEMAGTDIRWAYNDQTNQLIPLDKNGHPIPKNLGQPFQQNIARINMGLQALTNVAKEDGQKDIRSFLMNTLRESGVDVSKGYGNTIMKTLAAPAMQKSENETGSQKLGFNDESGMANSDGQLAINGMLQSPAHHFAAVRTNNPGAQWPNKLAEQFGATGYENLKDGNKIATFPTPIHGAAANMALLSKKYVGKSIGDAEARWSGGHRSSLPGYASNIKITEDMVHDPNFMIPFMKATANAEAPHGANALSEEDWKKAYKMYSDTMFQEASND